MFDGVDDILKELSPEQQAACTAPNNVLLTACPGSGKTRTLTPIGIPGTPKIRFKKDKHSNYIY